MYDQEMQPKSNAFGITALVTGICSLLFAFCCSWLGVILALVAIIFGLLARKEKQNFDIAGIVLGCAGLVLSIVMIILNLKFLGPLMDDFLKELDLSSGLLFLKL